MSRGNAHRLLGAARFLEILKTSPRGEVFPMMEAQIRPLLRLSEPEQQVTAWNRAVEIAGDGQPSGPQAKQAVLEIQNPGGLVTKPSPRAQRIELIRRIKEVIQQKKSWGKGRENDGGAGEVTVTTSPAQSETSLFSGHRAKPEITPPSATRPTTLSACPFPATRHAGTSTPVRPA